MTLFKKYYYVRYQNLTYAKGLEYATVCTGTFAEIHKHCIQIELSKGNKVESKKVLQILDIRKISKKDYEYFTAQSNEDLEWHSTIQNTINIQSKEINKGFAPTMTPDMYAFLDKKTKIII